MYTLLHIKIRRTIKYFILMISTRGKFQVKVILHYTTMAKKVTNVAKFPSWIILARELCLILVLSTVYIYFEALAKWKTIRVFYDVRTN